MKADVKVTYLTWRGPPEARRYYFQPRSGDRGAGWRVVRLRSRDGTPVADLESALVACVPLASLYRRWRQGDRRVSPAWIDANGQVCEPADEMPGGTARRRLPKPAPPPEPRGVVYLVQAGAADGPLKIGFSRNANGVGGRLQAIRTHNAAPPRVLGVARGSRSDERLLHTLFAAERQTGEWFRPSPRLLSFAELVGQGVNLFAALAQLTLSDSVTPETVNPFAGEPKETTESNSG